MCAKKKLDLPHLIFKKRIEKKILKKPVLYQNIICEQNVSIVFFFLCICELKFSRQLYG